MKVIVVALALSVGAVVVGCSPQHSSAIAQPAKQSEARRLVANGALLLDVRTPEEFAAGHIDGAVNIPVQQLPARIAEVGEKDRPVVVYCRSGNRSAKAAKILENAGYGTVHDLGPMSAW